MANHADFVEFAVQGGDGVFTSRESVVLVSDREYQEGEQVIPICRQAMVCLHAGEGVYDFCF